MHNLNAGAIPNCKFIDLIAMIFGQFLYNRIMELWVLLAILAAATQALRTAVQKKMTPQLGSYGASYIRFSYSFPFAWLIVLAYMALVNVGMPSLSPMFWFWITVAAVTQIAFTILLIMLFSHRSFAAAVAFSKTEVLQAALFEAIILGVIANLQTAFAIALGVVATIMLSLAKASLASRSVMSTIFSKQTGFGLGAGAFLGFCTVAYGAAIKHIPTDDVMLNAGLAAAIAVTIQTVGFGAWLYAIKRHELIASLVHWRDGAMAGFWGTLCSLFWFAAFAMHAVAPVRAVGQIELLMSIGFSFFYFKEKINLTELIAMALLAISIILVLLA
ncbi:MAG: DMT family transporter [Candidatus Puniceispirillum sp.]|uniref:DMT family transporter n=1 Tax=Candidatus Puniceispirillum sp. TaxID=2026719 RepID=UPI001EBF320A|nr:DMT family transporter [Candidatus Puniceispirillum sp.]MBT6414721.1 DMT family transporter [Candidatus Puniceispirillum sp.]MBT6566438.1 DMT family transporter [Candidatus Puniceispirillum sp.]